MIKSLIVSYLETIQDMWQPWPDDSLLSFMSKLLAMLLVAMGIFIIGLGCWFAILLVFHPILLAYVVIPICLLYTITYGIAHLNLKKRRR